MTGDGTNKDTLDLMMAWEDGTLSDEDTLTLFQRLVNNGMAWRLQGVYGRTASAFLERGLIRSPFETIGDSHNG